MIETYRHTEGCCDLTFSWDTAKYRQNRSKHGLSFKLASNVFHDPTVLTKLDLSKGKEDREQTLGIVGSIMLFVVHTIKVINNVQTIRIISARKATKGEATTYRKRTHG
jgi:uncharacterized DUF497 family protein